MLNVTDLNTTNDYDIMIDDFNNSLSINNCTTNDYNIDLNIPSLLITIPCGLSFLGLLNVMV